MLNVVEKFVSIDGEGSRAGEPTIFVRLGGCNLRCKYCDTMYANIDLDNTDNVSKETVINIVKDVKTLSRGWIKNVTLTGGEPLLNKASDKLILNLCNIGFNVNVETNGTIVPRIHHPNLFYTVDYKCSCSGEREKMNSDVFYQLGSNDIVKCVVANKDDLLEALAMTLKFPFLQFYFSPVYGEIDPKEIVDFILHEQIYNAKVQLQLHKLIWDPNERGV